MTDSLDISNFPCHIINGQEIKSQSIAEPNRVESINPFSGELLWLGEAASSATVDAAVAAARAAFPAWARLGFSERHALLTRFVELVKEEAETLTRLIATEAGKPLWESKVEVNSLVTKLPASVDAYNSRAAESSREVRGLRSRTRFRPQGVMAVLGPFNFPASMANGHIMPALLAGNTVVFKPSELTPLTGVAVSRIWQRAGLPPGVMNCVSGARQTGEYLVSHKDVNGVLLVGSHPAGLAILRKVVDAPEKVVALEMGGNSPLVIWDYDDIDPVVSIIIQSAFMSGGQRCSAARRLLLRDDDTKVMPRLLEVLRSLKIGDFNLTPEPYYGPLIRASAAERVDRRVKELVSGGADLILKPTRQGPIGTVVSPGLIGVDNCSNDLDEEIFGPVLKVHRYKELDEAIALANQTKFGLAAGIVCRSREVFEHFFDNASAGIVNWNQQLTGATTLAPFGGIKQSGNFRPAGFMSVDYCSYAIASFEVETPKVPDPPVAGITFQ
ncbi:MAG TPA: succinylglutamate-semialdehyde dehydrogenase [Acidobacteriaceae bacterium]